jgi:di/tricarboxylate transporter
VVFLDTNQIIVLIILLITVIALIFEFVRIDIVALICVILLGWTGILSSQELFSGFSSSAVIVMISVMIMGVGIQKTGIMDQFSQFVLSKNKGNEKKILLILTSTVGILSSLIQNIGAVALFLPGVLNISKEKKIPKSRLIMPIGFAAILGGTITMVGSGPLILVNDFLKSASLQSYNIFSVTPIGILLLISGIVYFYFFGKYVLPKGITNHGKESHQEKLINSMNLPHSFYYYTIPPNSPIIGKTINEVGIFDIPDVNIIALSKDKSVQCAPWRQTIFEEGEDLLLIGKEQNVKEFAEKCLLTQITCCDDFKDFHYSSTSGFAEVIIPHGSEIVGETIREYSFRRRHAIEPVILFNKGEEIRCDFSDHKIIPGDSMIVYGLWEHIAELKRDLDFVVATPFKVEKKNLSKQWEAIACFLLSIILSLFGVSAPLAFLTGAVGMILLNVISIEEAYRAIEWKVIFLIAGLIPLGLAMQKTGAAVFLAQKLMAVVVGKPTIIILLIIGLLSTIFSLIMTNVGAIVVLAPLVIEFATLSNLDPRALVLLAAVSVANSFILPTHQVNALIISPGGYTNKDFFKAGSGMTILFLLITVLYFNFVML